MQHQAPERVADLMRAREWRAQHGGAVFPTNASFEWFTRNHRAELVASGQYIPRPGSGGSLVGPGFESVVLAIIRREARAA